MTPSEFVKLNAKQCLAIGTYETKCAPYPLTVYYALMDGLEEVGGGRGQNKAAFWGEVVEGLEDLDLDF